jgi:DNA invertase Pin-like site-specific DNA recombinase
VDVVVVWRLDRLSRSFHRAWGLLNDFEGHGVRIVSCREMIDTRTPAGRLHFRLAAAMAEFEREIVSERTSAGIEAARRRGAKLGRPRVTVELDRARAMVAAGMSVRSIARVLGVANSTLQRAMSPATSASNRDQFSKAPQPSARSENSASPWAAGDDGF